MKLELCLDKILLAQRHNGKFCDVTFRIGDETISAHRCVLAGATEYFDRMFCTDIGDKGKGEIDFSYVFSASEPLRIIIDHIYGVEVSLSEKYLNEIINASKLFLLDKLTEECAAYLRRTLNIENSLQYWSLASAYELKSLNKICAHVVTSRFHDVIKDHDEALLVSPQDLSRFAHTGLRQHCDIENWKDFLHRWTLNGKSEEHEQMQQKLSFVFLEGNVGSAPRKFTDLARLTGLMDVRPVTLFIDNTQQVRKKINRAELQKSVQVNERLPEAEVIVSTIPGPAAHGDTDKEIFSYLHTLLGEMTPRMSEEVLVCTDFSEALVYRPNTNKWLIASKHYYYSEVNDDDLVGVGISGMYTFRRKDQESLLKHITNDEEILVPHIGNVHGKKFFNVQGALFCAEFSSLKEDLHMTYWSQKYEKRLSVSIYVANINAWKHVCQSEEVLYNPVGDPCIVQCLSGDAYIYTAGESASLYQFVLKDGKLYKLSTVPPTLLEESFEIHWPRGGHTTSSGLVFFCSEKYLLYNMSIGTWRIEDSVPLSDPVSEVKLSVACYMDTFGTEIYDRFRIPINEFKFVFPCLLAYSRVDEMLYTIPPPPIFAGEQCVSRQFVATAILDELEEKVFNLDETSPVLFADF